MKNKNKKTKKRSEHFQNNINLKTKRKKPKKTYSEILENIDIIGLIIKIILIILLLVPFVKFFIKTEKKIQEEHTNIKVALCTMGRNENLYINEFVEHYLSLGVDTLFLYDDNIEEKDKFKNALPQKDSIVIEYTKDYGISGQNHAYNHCYSKHKNDYDWFIMIDMDEYLVIKNNDTLKGYLTDHVFDKCDFLKLHWRIPSDNGLLHYENKSLFERFKRPYYTSNHIKSIIRGHINNLEFWIHSPKRSPERNITCDNIGRILNKTKLNFQSIMHVNTDRAYFVHFFFRSTEEYINKYKRGYKDWPHLNKNGMIQNYFKNNKLTIEKVEMFEKELNITLDRFRNKLHIKKK